MQETKVDLINLDSRPAKSAAKEKAAAPQEKTGSFKARNIKLLILSVGEIPPDPALAVRALNFSIEPAEVN
jgi:hypothetical protein